jgi:predicted secreted protein
MRFLPSLACSLLLWSSACVWADDGTDLSRTRVQLDARASAEVDNDSMRATLFAEVEDAGAARAAEQVNRAVRDATATLDRISGLRVRTGGYSTFPVSEKGRIVRWRARAEIVVEGGDFQRVSESIGRVQDRMQLAGVEFFVSAARRAQVEAELTQDAIAEFLARAERVARAFRGSGFHVTDATVSSDAAMPPPQPMMARSMMADADAPRFDGGTSRIAVAVSGTVAVLR